MVSYEGHNFFIQGGLVGSRNRNMSGMLELDSPRCLNLTAEFKLKKQTDSNRQHGRLFTFEFQFEFWGVLPALFYP
jgi:hypothetical protein